MGNDTFYADNKGAEIARLARRFTSVAEMLREDSVALLRLPRELRNEILGYLYTDSTPGHPIWWENHVDVTDPQFRALPDDPYCYMNASIVDPQIAIETATVFYSTNYFEVPPDDNEELVWILDTDHYGSGVAPKDVLTRLHLSRPLEGCVDLFMPPVYASQLRDFVLRKSASPVFSKNDPWSTLLEARNLRTVEFHLSCDIEKLVSTPEMLLFKMLEERGVSTNVRISLAPRRGYGASRDYSLVFNKPTTEEVHAMSGLKPEDAIYYECRVGLLEVSDETDEVDNDDSEEDNDSSDDEKHSVDGSKSYVHYTFPQDEQWEVKWRVYLQELHDKFRG